MSKVEKIDVAYALSEEEERYYETGLREAEKIAKCMVINTEQPFVEYVVAVFNKIATPLFYLRGDNEQVDLKEEQDNHSGKEKQIRKKKAGERLSVECVGDIAKGIGEWIVGSEAEPGKTYRVRGNVKKDDYECECPDYTFRDEICKHIEAVKAVMKNE